MDAFIKNLRIKNFKSIKDVELDCERINLFIGEPNVGKSNVLEAISLLGGNYSQNREKFLSEFIRYEEVSDFFHFDNLADPVEVITNIGAAYIRSLSYINSFDFILGYEGLIDDISGFKRLDEVENFMKDKANIINNNSITPIFHSVFKANGSDSSLSFLDVLSAVKKYTFALMPKVSNKFSLFLLPPFGTNLYTIIEKNQEAKKKFGKEFKKYGLELLLDVRAKKFEIQRRDEDLSYKIPYSSMADTLQRFIFYLTAVDSNKNSVILFEEIESHSFPRYVQELAQKMIDSKDNQFFVTTHSPYLLNAVMSEKSDVAIFLATYEDFQTKITRLDDDEVSELLNHGLDVFYNLKGLAHEQEP